MILLHLQRTALIVGAAVAVAGMAERFGPRPALLSWAVVAADACAVGAVLLRTS